MAKKMTIDPMRTARIIYNLDTKMQKNMKDMIECGEKGDYVRVGELIGMSICDYDIEIEYMDNGNRIKDDMKYGKQANEIFNQFINAVERKYNLLNRVKVLFERGGSAEITAWAEITEEVRTSEFLDWNIQLQILNDAWLEVSEDMETHGIKKLLEKQDEIKKEPPE